MNNTDDESKDIIDMMNIIVEKVKYVAFYVTFHLFCLYNKYL